MTEETKQKMAEKRIAKLKERAIAQGATITDTMTEKDIHAAMRAVKAPAPATPYPQPVMPKAEAPPVPSGFTAEQQAYIDQVLQRALSGKNVAAAGIDAAAIATEITKAAAQQFKRSMTPEIDAKGYYNPDHIDPEDRLKTPRVYFCPRYYENISFTMIRGVPEALPMGWQRFHPDSAANVRQGDEATFKYVSKAVVWSKKQAEALDIHEHFGIKFYSNMNAARNAGEERMEIMAKWASMLANKGFDALCQMAAAQDPPIMVSMHDTTARIRMRLVAMLTDKEVGEMAHRARELQNAGNKEALLMG